ncbi:acetyl-CoA carboxylase biotin carboxyl carrier protein [Clostridiaceae bacterium M8S5]|nr:acetyl-CoA carboxylase biotin carboxyl carrier protein [Clostridiaceae bacterium M8S5]
MQADKIKEIIKLIDNTDINILELETEGLKLKLQKNANTVLMQDDKKDDSNHNINNIEVTKEKNDKTNNMKYKEIKSPIVGTFYSSPSPDSSPFIKIGDKVKKGDVLCIIEAMKVMNEIQADEDGEVLEIVAENESMVEYGEVLIKIV